MSFPCKWESANKVLKNEVLVFEYLKNLLSPNNTDKSSSGEVKKDNNQKIQIAACALFIEMAQADGEFSDEERQFIIEEMERTFNLDQEYVDELIGLAERRIRESVSLYEFTQIINLTFSQEQKIELIESLWKLIYQDKKLDAYEDQLIKRIAGTLNVEHKKIINAKLWVKEQMGLKS